MTLVRITKVFSFDMAHALDGYQGLCKNIHGHTYHLRVTIAGTILDAKGHPQNGLVIDFGDLKRIVKQEVLDKFDHAIVLMEGSALLQLINKENNERLIVTPFQPSCENLLLHFVALLLPQLPGNVKLIAARLDETPNSYAEWYLSDQQ